MVIASIIMGALLIGCGIYCMIAPIDTYFSLAYVLASLLFVYGICGIVRFFSRRTTLQGLLVSGLAVALGFIYIFRPGSMPAPGVPSTLDRVAFFIIAAWFLLKGLAEIAFAYKTRFVNGSWGLSFIAGVCSVVLGVYSFIYPATAALTTGILTGCYFLECGLDLVVFGMTAGHIQGAVRDIDRNVRATLANAAEAAERDAEAAERGAEADEQKD